MPPVAARSAGHAGRRAGSREPRSATRCTACSRTCRSTRRLPPARGELEETVRAWYPAATDVELERIAELVDAYCRSALATRLASLAGARPERPFAFEHDGVLLHGRLDVLWRENGKALVVDYKSNALEGADPHEIVEAEYRLQRLVYALACLRDGAQEVEVVYQFLERPEDVVSATFTRRRPSGARVRALGRDRAHPRRRVPCRRRASSPAPAAPRSISSARGRDCLVRAIASRRARRGAQRHPRQPAGARGGSRGGRAGGCRRDRLRRRRRVAARSRPRSSIG